MHNPESVLENETHKLLWDFEVQMDFLISGKPTQQQQKITCRPEGRIERKRKGRSTELKKTQKNYGT